MDKLFSYLPPFFRDIREFRAIFEAVGAELEILRAAIETAIDNQFVSTADTAGLKRLARSLQVAQTYADPEDLRFALRSLLLDKRPYTMKMLDVSLRELCGENGYTLSRDAAKGVLSVRLDLRNKDKFDAVKKLLDRIVPADMIIDAHYLYNTHAMLSGKTHAALAAFTHEKIRSDVL